MTKLTKLFSIALSMGIVVLGLGQVHAQTMCTAQYDPVCGVNGTTYGNACMAQGAEIAYQGECSADPILVDPSQNNDNTACTLEYMPVCGEIQVQCVRAPCPPIRTTYSNKCVAEAAGATIVFEADCNIAESGPIVDLPSEMDKLPTSYTSLVNKITWANSRGITKYNTVDTFMPDQILTREQAAKMLVAAVQSQAYLDIPLKEKYCVFADQASIDPTLSELVNIACQYGLFQGYKGNFMPTMFMNDMDAMTIIGRVAEYSPAISMYLATSQFAIPTYQPMTRAMFVDRLYTMSSYIDQYQDQQKIMLLDWAQSDLDKARTLWNSKKATTYTMVQQKTCFCMDEYTRPMIYNVVDGSIVGKATYEDDMSQIGADVYPELHTVEQAFMMIQEAIDAQSDGVTVEYDATRGYPHKIFIDRSKMMADEEQYYTFTITSTDKNSILSGTTIDTKLIGDYHLIAYDATGITSTGITLNITATRFGATFCNILGSDYTLSGNKMMFGPMISTMMFCNDKTLMSMESAFGGLIEATYTIDGDVLSLTSQGRTWKFQKHMPAVKQLAGTYILQSYDGVANTNNNITMMVESNRVSAKICNSISSNFMASDTVITFDPMASTKMMCANQTLSAMETSFTTMTNANYTMSGKTLTIMNNGNTWVWMMQ